jgi:acetyl esterase
MKSILIRLTLATVLLLTPLAAVHAQAPQKDSVGSGSTASSRPDEFPGKPVETVERSRQAAVEKIKEMDLPKPTVKLVYKNVGQTELVVWVWKPVEWRATDRRPAMVFYHGGGWDSGTPAALSRQAARFAELGMVACSVQYRLTSQPGVEVADCVKDARSAFRWIRTHAGELGIDPNKIAAGGASAGGHLAAALVTLEDINDATDDLSVSTRPSALVLLKPALKLDPERAIKKGRAKTDGEVTNLSPFHRLKAGMALPPTLILHGADDTTVPISTVREYAARVKELGGECEVIGFAGETHGTFNQSPMIEATLARMETFLETQEEKYQ